MKIAREQEVALWKLLAEAYNLEYRGYGLYRGTCPFCDLPKIFGMSSKDNFSECLDCGKGGDSLESSLKALFEISGRKSDFKTS